MIQRIDHISIAVKDFDKAKSFFETLLGAVSGASGKDDQMQYFWNIFSLGDLSRLELMKATGEDSFLKNFLAARKDGGVHHISLETADIKKVRRRLEEHNVPFFGYMDDQEDWKELFIHPKDAFGILIQIEEMPDPNVYLPESARPDSEKPWQVKKTAEGAAVSIAHPGGGTVDIDLTRQEVADLMTDLTAVISGSGSETK